MRLSKLSHASSIIVMCPRPPAVHKTYQACQSFVVHHECTQQTGIAIDSPIEDAGPATSAIIPPGGPIKTMIAGTTKYPAKALMIDLDNERNLKEMALS